MADLLQGKAQVEDDPSFLSDDEAIMPWFLCAPAP